MALTTLSEVKDALVVDSTDDDALLGLLMDAASEAVVNYLKVDAGSLDPVPAVVKVATIMLTAFLYNNRNHNPDETFRPGYLPAPVVSLLYPLRDPSIA